MAGPSDAGVERLPMPTSDAPITIDLSSLSLDDVRLGDNFIGMADLAIRHESDKAGRFSLLEFRPRPGMPAWVATIIGLPQFEFTHGISSIELEACSAGAPLRIVADGRDQQAECFELGFCPNDTVWDGWKTFRIGLIGDDRGEISLTRQIIPPVRIKWLIIIMRQGQPWQLGLRGLRIKPVRGPAPTSSPHPAAAGDASANRAEVRRLLERLHVAQQRVTNGILATASFESLLAPSQLQAPDPHGPLTVNDILRMWTWHFWSHHRDLVMARGRLVNDNPHFHVPHHVREASEQFGRFIGELACMTDEQLDLRVPGGRSAREVVAHVLESLETFFVQQIRQATPAPAGAQW